MKQSKKHSRKVKAYYENTRAEYRLLWRARKNLGLHFGCYDKENTTHDQAITNLNRQLAQVAKIDDKSVVLDAGCGVGGTAIWLAKNLGCSCTGINIVPTQIERANKNAANNGVQETTNFIVADFSDTGLSDKKFDVFMGVESIVHAEDKKAVLAEAYRVLKPGGRLVVCEYMLVDDNMNKKDHQRIDEWLHGWAMPSILSEKSYSKSAKECGFKNIVFHDWTKNAEPSFKRLDKYARAFRKLVPILKATKIAKQEQFNNLSATEAQMDTFKKGLWKYKVLVAEK